ncbi:PAS domain S-box protein [Haloplanus sp.]|uniref:PAS domain S-box protein n=1 Tax=Haloplanus sp. TaxID=1961696 RepID=UPI002621417C|nr:PAS domain S-box protein [Haloplanus sp.]
MRSLSAEPSGHSGPARVLHVDDDGEHAELVATFLEREDDRLAVETAISAAEGLDRLADGRFDCVVSDYEMPEQNGIGFLEAVRESHSEIPFILYTGKGSEAVASEAISAGVTDYLQKDGGTEQYAVLANRIRNAVDRHRAERASRRQRRAIETTQDGISLLDDDGVFIYVNEAYADLYGYDPDEMIGEKWELVYPEEEVSFVRGTILPTVTAEGSWHGETTGLRADGSVFPEEHVVSQADAGTIVCTVRDRSEREEWQADVARFRTLVERLNDPVYVVDEDGRFEYVNDTFVDRFGYERSEVLGSTPDLVEAGDGTTRTKHRLGRLRSDDGPEQVRLEVEIQPKVGDPVLCEDHVGVLSDDGETFDGLVGILRDITDRKEYEERLHEERAFIEQCLDALDDVFYVFDRDGTLRRWNDRLGEVTGYTDDEIASMTATDFIPEDHVPKVTEAIETVFTEGRATVQAEYLTADGERIPHEFTGYRLTDSEGDVLGFAGIGRDLRRQREYERQLEQRNERLEEFASIVSHDLRNPLNVAGGHLELARAEHDSRHLESVAEAHTRIEELIEELLTLAREGTIALDLEAVSLTDIARASWGTVETDAATLSTDGSVTIRADESRVRQLLENLFRNSVEHSAATGRPGVDDGGEHGVIESEASSGNDNGNGDGDGVTVRVGSLNGSDGFYIADDGPGIPEAERANVFESGVTTSDEGIGVGLSIVKRVADAHGWDVRVTESSDGGARFELTGVEVVDRRE